MQPALTSPNERIDALRVMLTVQERAGVAQSIVTPRLEGSTYRC